MKPWREIAVPHSDVLKGTFQQAEFAADITAVRTGKAQDVYQDAAMFFDRTYITEGMHQLLTQVALRLAGRGGEPVIQLQTAFGGGKTHTMLAVWHLATRQCALSELPGVASLVEQAGLMDVPRARVAVLDGTAHSPGQPRRYDGEVVKTLWGELAWQLGGSEGFALVRESDAVGASPGKEILRALLSQFSPCVVLVDELVAYIGQFPDGQNLSGGTYDSNLAFVQALTEAVKLVPNAVLLASLPESEVEAGSSRGVGALRALEKRFGRVQAVWKPVAAEESFEIVRRRLFEPIRDDAARDAVCRAFYDAYRQEGSRLPGETQHERYLERLRRAYPIHPELFDRLYEDWATIDGFQRTRGVLKLMANVISRLWKANNTDLLVMPGSLPLTDGDVRSYLTEVLQNNWDPVLDGDIDGERAEATELEAREPRFGKINAAQRVARTLFLGSAPSSVAATTGARGLDRARVLLGSLQAGQPSGPYSDALDRLVDQLHYLNSTGDKRDAATRYWFDTRANLRREMEDRRKRVDPREVDRRIQTAAGKLFQNTALFEGVHVFTPHADVPDDSALRLVLLPPESFYLREMRDQAERVVHEYLRSHGGQPRHRANRLLFVAPDHSVLGRMRDAAGTAIAWRSIVDDVEQDRLNLDRVQQRQAQQEAARAEEVLPRVVRECYKWLLCPSQDEPTAQRPTIEAFPMTTASGTPSGELERACRDHELVIETWSPVHLRNLLKQYYWKADAPFVQALRVWEDSLRYPYLPRLRKRETFAVVVTNGATAKDFFGVAQGPEENDGRPTKDDRRRYVGLQLAVGGVQLNDTLLLIEPGEAQRALEAIRPMIDEAPQTTDEGRPTTEERRSTDDRRPTSQTMVFDSQLSSVVGRPSSSPAVPRPTAFRGIVDVNAALARSQLDAIAREIIALLQRDPAASVHIVLDIEAKFPNGADESLRRSVSENAATLKFVTREWQEGE